MHVDPLNDRHCYADTGMDIVDKDTNPEDEYIYRTKEVWLGKEANFEDSFKEILELPPEEESEIENNSN